MKILDANMILRFLLKDDEKSAVIVRDIIKSESVMVLPEIIAEVVYVMTRVYKYERIKTSSGIAAFLNYHNIVTEKNAVVIGISKDSVASHKRFEQKYNLPFTILSDTELSAIQAYDVWKEKKNYGKVSMGVVRTTYLIDENGIIIKSVGKVKAAENPAQMLGEL